MRDGKKARVWLMVGMLVTTFLMRKTSPAVHFMGQEIVHIEDDAREDMVQQEEEQDYGVAADDELWWLVDDDLWGFAGGVAALYEELPVREIYIDLQERADRMHERSNESGLCRLSVPNEGGPVDLFCDEILDDKQAEEEGVAQNSEFLGCMPFFYDNNLIFYDNNLIFYDNNLNVWGCGYCKKLFLVPQKLCNHIAKRHVELDFSRVP